MPAVYTTGHEIADRVAKSVAAQGYSVRKTPRNFYDFESADCHIAYGILRGTSDVFAAAKSRKEKFIFLDKGFFKPNHFSGYYRFGINRFQMPYEAHCFSTDRLEQVLGKEDQIKRNIFTSKGHEILVIPPSEAVSSFYNLGSSRIWLQNTLADLAERTERPIRVRFKSSQSDLDDHLGRAYCVVGHSSSVLWEALRRGIPAIGQNGSIVHDWNQLTINDLDDDEKMKVHNEDVVRLMSFMAHYQFTLDEIERGMAKHLIEGIA